MVVWMCCVCDDFVVALIENNHNEMCEKEEKLQLCVCLVCGLYCVEPPWGMPSQFSFLQSQSNNTRSWFV